MQKFVGTARLEHRADVALFVTTCRTFTKAALGLALRQDVVALYRDLLGSWGKGAQRRPGSFDLGVVAECLGIVDSDRDGSRPFAVVVSGAGFGDEETFDAEHEGMDLLPLIGFAPTHDVGVVAMCNGQVDHAVTDRPARRRGDGHRRRRRRRGDA